MGRHYRLHCRICGGHVDYVGELSARGKCEGCAVNAIVDAVNELQVQRGPIFEKWATNLIRRMTSDAMLDKLPVAKGDVASGNKPDGQV